jgi:hypothetical protein
LKQIEKLKMKSILSIVIISFLSAIAVAQPAQLQSFPLSSVRLSNSPFTQAQEQI